MKNIYVIFKLTLICLTISYEGPYDKVLMEIW